LLSKKECEYKCRDLGKESLLVTCCGRNDVEKGVFLLRLIQNPCSENKLIEIQGISLSLAKTLYFEKAGTSLEFSRLGQNTIT